MPNSREESERTTRRKRIDPLLRQQGWTIVPFVPGRPTTAYTFHAVTEYPTANGPVDYALFVGGILVGVIEAKRLSLGPQNVLNEGTDGTTLGNAWDKTIVAEAGVASTGSR